MTFLTVSQHGEHMTSKTLVKNESSELQEKISEYNEKGFTIFRNVIDKNLIQEANDHIEWLRKKFPQFRPEHMHHPLMRDDAFWVRLATDYRLIDIAELFLGPNLALFTSHYICKPPFDGHAVLWHQDGAYWKLQPMKAATLWLAVDASTRENGCLRVIPSTHKLPLQKIIVRNDIPNMLSSMVDDNSFDPAEAVDIILQPGDVSVHHPHLIHGSEANTSNKRRCGLDLGFMSTDTSISNEGLYLHPILVRGTPVPNINKYRAWPEYSQDDSMPFFGSEKWNQVAQKANHQNPSVIYKSLNDESVIEITERMMKRLKEGTTKR